MGSLPAQRAKRKKLTFEPKNNNLMKNKLYDRLRYEYNDIFYHCLIILLKDSHGMWK